MSETKTMTNQEKAALAAEVAELITTRAGIDNSRDHSDIAGLALILLFGSHVRIKCGD